MTNAYLIKKVLDKENCSRGSIQIMLNKLILDRYLLQGIPYMLPGDTDNPEYSKPTIDHIVQEINKVYKNFFELGKGFPIGLVPQLGMRLFFTIFNI